MNIVSLTRIVAALNDHKYNGPAVIRHLTPLWKAWIDVRHLAHSRSMQRLERRIATDFVYDESCMQFVDKKTGVRYGDREFKNRDHSLADNDPEYITELVQWVSQRVLETPGFSMEEQTK